LVFECHRLASPSCEAALEPIVAGRSPPISVSASCQQFNAMADSTVCGPFDKRLGEHELPGLPSPPKPHSCEAICGLLGEISISVGERSQPARVTRRHAGLASLVRRRPHCRPALRRRRIFRSPEPVASVWRSTINAAFRSGTPAAVRTDPASSAASRRHPGFTGSMFRCRWLVTPSERGLLLPAPAPPPRAWGAPLTSRMTTFCPATALEIGNSAPRLWLCRPLLGCDRRPRMALQRRQRINGCPRQRRSCCGAERCISREACRCGRRCTSTLPAHSRPLPSCFLHRNSGFWPGVAREKKPRATSWTDLRWHTNDFYARTFCTWAVSRTVPGCSTRRRLRPPVPEEVREEALVAGGSVDSSQRPAVYRSAVNSSLTDSFRRF